MTLHLGWQLLPPSSLAPEPALLAGQWLQLAEAVEFAGLDALLLPASVHLPEPLTLCAALSARTQRLQLIAGVHTNMLLPAALATTAQSLQAISGNRLQLYLQPAANSPSLTADQCLEREREFTHVFSQLISHPHQQPLHHHGTYYRLEHAELGLRALPAPPLWLGAEHDPLQVSRYAKHCLINVAAPQQLAATVQRIRALGRERERRITCHGAIQLIARPTEIQAWDEASRRLADIPAHHVASHTAEHQASPLHEHPARRAEIYPNLWHPPGHDLPTLVGSYAQIASRIAELQDCGLDGLVFCAQNPVEECLRLGEEVIPLLRQREHQSAGADRP